MVSLQGDATGVFKAMTSDAELPVFDAEATNYAITNDFLYTAWASLSQYPDERRNIAIRIRNQGDLTDKTFDLSPGSSDAWISWWKGTSGTGEPPFETQRGTLKVTLNAATGKANGTFNFDAISQKGELISVTDGEFNLIPNDQGSAKP